MERKSLVNMINDNIKYVVIGAGGTGGCITAFMTKTGKNVTVIARGAHLEAIQKDGLQIEKRGEKENIKINAVTEAEYIKKGEKADVIFVCVKGYSVDSIYSFIKKASHEKTVVIPILNIYGTGEKMAKQLPNLEVLNGCIYIAGALDGIGKIKMSGDIFKVIFGRVDGDTSNPLLQQIEKDLRESGIEGKLSSDIRKETFEKFSFISPMAATGAYYHSTAGDVQKEGKIRETFKNCVREVNQIANAMGIFFDFDIVQKNLAVMDGVAKDCTASMQKDLEKGGDSEIDGLLFEVLRLGKKYNVPTPTYEKICSIFKA